MSFKERVPTTEYISAVNRAPVSLSEPNDSRRPIAGPLNSLSARLLSRGTCGRSMKTLSPSRWFSSERSALPSRAWSGRPASSRSASANRASSASFSAPCAVSNAGVWGSIPGVVVLQPRVVQPVDRRDALDPSLAPVRQSHLAGRALDKIAAHMGPTECKGHLALAKASESLVGAIAVADDDRVEEAFGEQLLRRLGAPPAIAPSLFFMTRRSSPGSAGIPKRWASPRR